MATADMAAATADMAAAVAAAIGPPFPISPATGEATLEEPFEEIGDRVLEPARDIAGTLPFSIFKGPTTGERGTPGISWDIPAMLTRRFM